MEGAGDGPGVRRDARPSRVQPTGSTAAGRSAAQFSAGTLEKVHLELGGNDALMVCEDGAAVSSEGAGSAG